MTRQVVPTACNMCYNQCSALATVEDGVVRYVEGNPDSPLNRGRMCAKGKAGIMNLYNPNRVREPLVRTNPNKGLDEDPGWEPIGWDEALEIVTDRLDAIHDEPAQLLMNVWESGGNYRFFGPAFGKAFGTPNVQGSMSSTCGKVIHPAEEFTSGGFHQEPDFHYCEYYLFVGTQQAVASRANLTHNMAEYADARQRGARTVVVDPVGNYAASKADEWLPIRPGTDAAFALAFMHVLVHELDTYDRGYLKYRSMAPYLVGPDGRYVRDAETRPLVWDRDTDRAVAYDDPAVLPGRGPDASGDGVRALTYPVEVDGEGPALTGSFDVDGVTCRPAFDRFAEHLRAFPPEWAADHTGINAATLRRLAREFADAARIGETIEIDSHRLPYRPAAVDWARGPQGHKHAFHHAWALKLINVLVGAVEVPGGILGTGTKGKTPRAWGPKAGPDGALHNVPGGEPSKETHIYTGRDTIEPDTPGLESLGLMAAHGMINVPLTNQEPGRYGLPSKITTAIFSQGNFFMSAGGDRRTMERFFRDLSFVLQFATDRNEVSQFADVLLPYPSYLEALDLFPNRNILWQAGGYGDARIYQLRQPVVEQPPGSRHPEQVLIDLADRLGISPGMYADLNRRLRLEKPHALDPAEHYDFEAVLDVWAKSWFGEERGLDWFREHGFVEVPLDADEVYTGSFDHYRAPLYLEPLVEKRDAALEAAASIGWEWDPAEYVGFPTWIGADPPDDQDGFDLLAVNYKLPFVYGAHGAENPWIDELCETDPYAYRVLIHVETAHQRGIDDGDPVVIESPVSRQTARAAVTRCIHPDVVGIAGHFGALSRGMPISHGKGVAMNDLLPHESERVDQLTAAFERTVPVRVAKVGQ